MSVNNYLIAIFRLEPPACIVASTVHVTTLTFRYDGLALENSAGLERKVLATSRCLTKLNDRLR